MKKQRVHNKYRVSILKRYPKLTIAHHLHKENTMYGTSNRKIMKLENGHTKNIGKFPFWYPRDFFGFSRLSTRASRRDKCNIYMNNAGKIFGIRAGSVYAIPEDNDLNLLFKIQGDCVLHRGICEDEQGWSYFGEYFMNPERNPVHIFRISPDLSTWEIAHTFIKKSIRHVHGIFRDPYNSKALWATVGDYEGECYIIHTDDRFQSVNVFGNGEQIWRAVNLFFTETHICWLTDSHIEQNYACRMDRKSGTIEVGQKIDCSGWYGCTTVENKHISFTTVERGPAILRDESSILISDDAFNWQEIYTFKKDRHKPYNIFKYGVISCPSGNMSLRDFYISGEGLVGLDGTTLQLRIEHV